MPQTLTYPGVYIEEVPSGVRTISGVATSIAAFIGWAARGDTDRATLVQSWQDFEREFGGLDVRSLLGYSVMHFFNNGGQQAYVIRLVADSARTAAVTLDTATPNAKLRIVARNPGDWATGYAVETKKRGDDPSRFALMVRSAPPDPQPKVIVESFENLSISSDDVRYVLNVLKAESSIVRAELIGTPTTPPTDTAEPSKLAGAPPELDGVVLKPSTGEFEAQLAAEAGGGTTGINLLDRVDQFNLLCVPGETTATVVSQLQKFCRDHRAFLIVDCAESATFKSLQNGPETVIATTDSVNSALYFPWVVAPDPLRENRLSAFPPCGFVAGVYARTDATRGLWKAPAGTDASLTGAAGVTNTVTDLENGELNVRAVNCVRNFPVYGNVVWGARTLRGSNEVGSEWKYIPVRRLALYIEESLFRGTKWVVFEPNDEPLWSQIRLNVGAFMQSLFRQGAFQGRSPREAYFVKCDATTTTQADINLGVVNILVGFAPLKPAEYVVIRIQQMAGQIQA